MARSDPAPKGTIERRFDEADARQLIELVAGCSDATMDFRVFPDSRSARARMSALFKSGGPLPRMKFRGTFCECSPKLQRANAIGMGIFYSLNKTDGHGVKGANIVRVRCIPVDLDEATPPRRWKPKPHMVMRSSPGRHQALFLIRPTRNFELAQNVAKRMALKFGGDPTVSDRARVLRLPGFYHRKAEPYRSRIISIDAELPRYTIEQLDTMLPSLPRHFISTNDKGIGLIEPDQAELLFDHLDVEQLRGNAPWQRFAMALHSACNADDDVAEMFFNFCASDGAYDEADDALNRRRWESFEVGKEGGLGIGTLRRLCLEFGVPGNVMFEIFNDAREDFDDE